MLYQNKITLIICRTSIKRSWAKQFIKIKNKINKQLIFNIF